MTQASGRSTKSVAAHAFYLPSLSGSVADANRFARKYGVACPKGLD